MTRSHQVTLGSGSGPVQSFLLSSPLMWLNIRASSTTIWHLCICSSLPDALLCLCNTAGTMSDQAELPVCSSSVSPRWPCKSRHMANVTALHGGLSQQTTKHAARSRPELAGFAARSSPNSQGEYACSSASARHGVIQPAANATCQCSL